MFYRVLRNLICVRLLIVVDMCVGFVPAWLPGGLGVGVPLAPRPLSERPRPLRRASPCAPIAMEMKFSLTGSKGSRRRRDRLSSPSSSPSSPPSPSRAALGKATPAELVALADAAITVADWGAALRHLEKVRVESE